MSHALPVSGDPHIQYRLDGAVFILQIDRPEKKNALTQGMYQALAVGIREAEASPDVKAVLLCGAPDCFTSGNDVNDFVQHETHGSERASVQATLAGRLADAGVPAVIAMQGKISMATVEAMMAAQSARIEERLTLGRALLLDRLDAMSPEARAAMADRLETARRKHHD